MIGQGYINTSVKYDGKYITLHYDGESITLQFVMLVNIKYEDIM